MLYEFFQWLSHHHHSFNVFNYLTLRAILAVLTALAISLLCGPSLIRYLTKAKIGQMVRSNGPQSHLSKQGIPTMGGVLLLSASLGTTLLWADLTNQYVWILIIVTAGFGAIGWVDDYRKIYKRNSKGLSFRQKMFWQTLLALLTAVVLAVAISLGNNNFHWKDLGDWLVNSFWGLPKSASLIVPFIKGVVIPMSLISFVVLTILVIVGSSNAVNLTDGLDGLAIMPVVMVAGALGIFAYASGNVIYANYLLIPLIPGAGEAIIFCAALVGSGLGFLWFNAYPAEVFMGDMGALALGAALGTLAVIVRQEIVYFIMSGVFVVEALSVMAQVGYFRYSGGQRIFRMAPLHHHFELSGWKENQVVVRFWILSIILVLIGLSSLKIR